MRTYSYTIYKDFKSRPKELFENIRRMEMMTNYIQLLLFSLSPEFSIGLESKTIRGNVKCSLIFVKKCQDF